MLGNTHYTFGSLHTPHDVVQSMQPHGEWIPATVRNMPVADACHVRFNGTMTKAFGGKGSSKMAEGIFRCWHRGEFCSRTYLQIFPHPTYIEFLGGLSKSHHVIFLNIAIQSTFVQSGVPSTRHWSRPS